jgi:hypothetical protein
MSSALIAGRFARLPSQPQKETARESGLFSFTSAPYLAGTGPAAAGLWIE